MRRNNGALGGGNLSVERSQPALSEAPLRSLSEQPMDVSDTDVLLSGSSDGDGNETTQRRPLLYVGLLTAFSGIAGFLFGYDTGNISGALPYIQDELLLEYKNSVNRLHWIEGVIVSAAIFGAAVGSAYGGALSDKLGRKAALRTADAFFTCGALVMAVSPNCLILITGRLLVGLGVGLASVTAPVYIAETAPASIRAGLVTVNTLMITTGQFAAYLLDYIFTFTPGTWRWMLGIAAVPALLQIGGLSFLPESPRWLISKGRTEEARRALTKLRKSGEVEGEMRAAADAAADLKQQRGLAGLRAPEVRLELFVGVGLQVLQQACGINTVMYFLVSILTLAGISDNRTALLVAMGPAAVNAVGTVLGMLLIDRSGRRRLMLVSIGGVVCALLLLGTAFRLSETRTPAVSHSNCPLPGVQTCQACIQSACSFCGVEGSSQADGVCIVATKSCPDAPRSVRFDTGCPSVWLPLVVAAIVLYLAAFSPGLGTVPWSVNAEIFPVEVRGLANGASATANWVTNAVVSQLFLALAGYIGASGVFLLLAGIVCAGGLWVYTYLPETKGLTLEEIQEVFVERSSAARWPSQLPQAEGD